MWQRLANDRGFTLTELLIATAVIGTVMAGVFVVQRGGQQAYLHGSSRVETQQNGRVALDLLSRELRSSTSITALGSATDITFVWTDEANVAHTIRYELAGTTLNRTVDGAMTPLIGGVQAFAMTYYSTHDVSSGTYTQTSNPGLVRVIKISLRTKTEKPAAVGTPGDAQTLMESTVTLRSSIG